METRNHDTKTRRTVPARLAVAILAAMAGTAAAQCEPSFNAPPGITYPEGVNGNVLCSVVWDRDGSGPLAPVLVIGGTFDSANTGGFNNIAMWDGSGWKALHLGTNGAVRALTIDTSNNTLVAGGSFTSAGLVNVNKVARFNPTSGLWSGIGTGVSGGDVNALTFDPLRNELYLGGTFTTAGGASTGALAKFNGSVYSAVGAFFSGAVHALHYFSGDGSVYIGGTFVDASLGNAANIIRYYPGNGSWSGLSGGLPGAGVFAITEHSPDGLNRVLVAGGSFGVVNGRTLNSIGYYAGGTGWFPLGTGVAGTVRGFASRNFGQEMYAVGTFVLNGTGNLVNRVARYSPGTNWNAIGNGLDAAAFTAATYKDAVYVGGSFTLAGNADGNTTATRIVMHNGSRWAALRGAPSGPVRCMLSMGSSLLIGGAFEMHVGNNVFAKNLVQYTGTQFVAGVGIQGFNGTNGPINAISYKSNGITIGTTTVAGKFTTAGAVNASNIASYQFAGEFSQVGQGVNGEVFGLATFGSTGGPNASLGTVAVGNFSHSGATVVNNIARWGPGAVSVNLGTGLNGAGRCVLPFGGKLLVGGSFTTAGGVLTGRLAQWDGTNWTTFNGALVNDTVYAMCNFNGKLVIGGDFTAVSGSPARKVAMYDGVQWVDMSAGLDTSVGSVTALAVHKGELYAGGNFATVSGQPRAIARWNGSSWVDIGSPSDPSSVSVLGTFNGSLMVGGDFHRAGSTYSPYLAEYRCSCWANCDGSTGSPLLTANDFQCFLNNYALGTDYANCDGSTGTPALTANDFQCYLNKYALGCQ